MASFEAPSGSIGASSAPTSGPIDKQNIIIVEIDNIELYVNIVNL